MQVIAHETVLLVGFCVLLIFTKSIRLKGLLGTGFVHLSRVSCRSRPFVLEFGDCVVVVQYKILVPERMTPPVMLHSVKVPTQYKRAGIIFKRALTEGKSVKSLVFQEKHAKIPNLLALFSKYSDNKAIVEGAIQSTNILTENQKMDPYLCRVLVTELLFGTKKLKGETCKPVQVVLQYKHRMEQLVTKEKKCEMHALKRINPRYVRINTNKANPEEIYKILKSEGFTRIDKTFQSYEEYLRCLRDLKTMDYLLDLHIKNLLVFHESTKKAWAQHKLVLDCKVLLQDKSPCLAPELLQPSARSTCLDMCAAPGMKTILLANMIGAHGKIYAVESDAGRYAILCNYIREAEATSVQTIHQDVFEISDKDCPNVEYILLDPPCSGSGMTGRISLESADEDKDKNRLFKLAGLQIKLLRHAMTAFPKVKRIVYSTCSLYEEENEEVVQEIIRTCGDDFKIMDASKLLSNQWINTGNRKFKSIGKKCLYARPASDFTCGFFVVVFERAKTA